MAVKTITIDLEAYTLLANRKREGQSFSAVIKETLKGKATAKDLLHVLSTLKVRDDTLDRLDEQVARRRKDSAKAPRL
ncbi:MAG: antitoxin VapB family protein [Nitrospirota bacterium]|nr:antitoxin VapB family protein [Nitrospirota bacterium]MDH5586249.1 antitoxin VapB family protein [Nitrospirota bacterium]MDH5774121.1 antitoxin VapB family protein [Nitrospirota bacterium]